MDRLGPSGLSGRRADAPLFHTDNQVRQRRCVCSEIPGPPMVLRFLGRVQIRILQNRSIFERLTTRHFAR